MPPRVIPARIHLIPAKDAPYLAVIRRKPANLTHISRWNTDTGEIEHGGWYVGRMYERRSDVSFDGQWWVFGTLGRLDTLIPGMHSSRHRSAWTGVARLPEFAPAFVQAGGGTLTTGGSFVDQNTLNIGWTTEVVRVRETPFTIVADHSLPHGLPDRLRREGWVMIDRTEWTRRSSDGAFTLRLRHLDYPSQSSGRNGSLSIDEAPGLLDRDVTWACFDCRGRLAIARAGRLEMYATSDAVLRGEPSFMQDLETLTPPRGDAK